MKMLKKLALVSAVSMISAGAFAMEAMDDEAMAATTGQDGITILIAPDSKTTAEVTALGVSAATQTAIDLTTNGVPGPDGVFKGLSITQINVHDDDGLGDLAAGSNGTSDNSGALIIGGNAAGLDRNGDAAVDALDTALDSTAVIADNASPIRVELDMVGNIAGGAGNAPMLNIAITTPTLGIKLGDIYVANSNAAADDFNADGGAAVDGDTLDTDGTAVAGAVRIISGFEIVVGGSTMVIQLGNEAQGSMIAANTTLIGGLTINNFSLFDNNGASTAVGGAVTGSISIGQLMVTDNGGANLTTNVQVDAVGTGAAAPLGEGLYIDMVQVGSASGINVSLNDVGIGSYNAATGMSTAAIIGDVQLIGLDASGTTMIIRGH